jgi:hypothetical protein
MRAVYSIVKSCGDDNARDKQNNLQHMNADHSIGDGIACVRALFHRFPPMLPAPKFAIILSL